MSQNCPLLADRGEIMPLLVPIVPGLGPSLSNPSILTNHSTGEVWVNIRNLNYILYHSEHNNFEHPWGPIVYLHPESELKLKTKNILAKLTPDLSSIEWHSVIDTSTHDKEAMWEFHGLEDGRLMLWDEKMYLCGVRRDDNPTGMGRMELSELDINEAERKVSEISRFKIPIPGPNPMASYCEKNWVPILDQPRRFVKWSNPLEVVEVDVTNSSQSPTQVVRTGKHHVGASQFDWRGGSQLLRVGGFYMHLVHETNLYFTEMGRKNAIYRHRILLRDPSTMELVAKSDPISFMDGKVEFCCGIALHPSDPSTLLITFGFQDNGAFLLKINSAELTTLCKPI